MVQHLWVYTCQLTEPWPGYRKPHTEGSPAASAPLLTDLNTSENRKMQIEKKLMIYIIDDMKENKEKADVGVMSCIMNTYCNVDTIGWHTVEGSVGLFRDTVTYQTAHSPPLHWVSGENVCDKETKAFQFSKNITLRKLNQIHLI